MNDLIFEARNFKLQDLKEIKSEFLHSYPMIYILYNENHKPAAYIGQTVQPIRRLQNHLRNSDRKKLGKSILIGHETFNQSATYNIESNLINYFIADNQYELQNVSQTSTSQTHNYYQKSFYNEEIFHEIWGKLKNEGLVKDTIDNLKNKDIFKLSPYKELSFQQLDIKQKIIDFCKQKSKEKDGNHVFIIEGDAGTGKSVLLSSLFNTIQDYSKDDSSDLHKTQNYFLVNHEEMLKTYKNIAGSLRNLKKKSFLKPTAFINSIEKVNSYADITLVDEAHLLLSKKDSYNNFHYENQLDEIIKRSKITIVIFDPSQVMKIKSYWNEQLLEQITENYNADKLKLTDQFRINASTETLNWIESFKNKKLQPIPKQKDESFDLKIFNDPKEFKNAIKKQNNSVGLSRIVSTFDYLHKKDDNTYYVDEEGINMPWNRTERNMTWAENPETIKEVGSIYTVQGFDLNYVGVILGPSISYDDVNDQLTIDPSQYKDTAAFTKRKDFSNHDNENIKENIILNSLNVLMKRGIHGLYIYATDPKLREKLFSLNVENHSK
ncbi:DUF2075 domain-containing protein [Salibacterium halotolerans]|uniref:GIY-YIG domain-containing protein n=1 Tax=Salibacterium halotolerans TaxID=1884432 RepID=A0A1I5PS64_9BACI|nr:DUF2075 domain-containing protein [Salibacterium halotolerans]SFP36978.1 hypothetical protein SAMN05518683_104214 [Salibacterium halotolerans]